MKLEIHSLDELVAFVALMRGETFERAKIAEMTESLRASTAALSNAEEADRGVSTPKP